MSSTHQSLESAIARYAEVLLREATRRATFKRRGLDADDIASDIAVKFLKAPEVIMATYPDPAVYARVALQHACVAHDRAQRVQRCEGVRLITKADGVTSTGRSWISGNALITDTDSEVFDLAPDTGGSFEDHLVEGIDATLEFWRRAEGLPPERVREVLDIDGHGYEVAEVAARCGQRRETVSRRVNATRQHLRQTQVAGRPAKDTPA